MPIVTRQSPAADGAMRTPTPRPQRRCRARPPPHTMKVATLLVAWLACSAGEPLSAVMQRRSSRPGVYADTFVSGYRPFAYVAVPLHAPVPVLHVLYPASAPSSWARPLERRRAPPASNTIAGSVAAQPSQIAPVYASAMPHGWFAPSWPARRRPPPLPAPTTPPPEMETALDVVYARPTAQGGYAYSRRRTRRPAARRPPPPQPVIIRVHKYRVVRDR